MTTNHAFLVGAEGASNFDRSQSSRSMRECLPCHIGELSPLPGSTSAQLETKLSVYSPLPHSKHPEVETKVTRYALTGKWILAQKLRIPKILWVIGLCTDRLVSS